MTSANPDDWRLRPEQRRELLDSLGDEYILGFQLGVTISWSDAYAAGWRDAEQDMAGAWAKVAADVQRRASLPRHDELKQRRQIEHEDMQPCPRRCKTCASCWAYEQWWRRGKRPYLGVAREAELEQQAVAS